MRFPILMATLFGVVALGVPAWADDKYKGQDETEKAFGKIAQLGAGVHAIQTDKKGRIESCVIVGQSRISTTLGKAKGLEVARDRARLAASAQFVKFLKEKVSVHEKSESETILLLEGSDDALKESGKAVEKDSKKMESVSEGLVRGLQVLYVETSEKDKTFTMVLGWDSGTSKATKKVGEDLKDDPKSQGGNPEKTPVKNPEKIDDKKVISDDAKKFLPKKTPSKM